MFLVDNFKIILLVGLVCIAGIRPSRAATKCMEAIFAGQYERSVACKDGMDTCFLGHGGAGGNVKAQGCAAEEDCKLKGKEFNCEKVERHHNVDLLCCCKDDDCNTVNSTGKYHFEFCKQREKALNISGCLEPMLCYNGSLPRNQRNKFIECESYPPDDVCFVAALPAGRLLPRDSLKVTKMDAGSVIDALGGRDLVLTEGDIGETGCKPKAECPIEDGKEWQCNDKLCCCNTKECNSPEGALFKYDFCKQGRFAERCPREGTGGPSNPGYPSPGGLSPSDSSTSDNSNNNKKVWNAATGPFQHYYGGFPFAVLVAASIYYFPLEAFF